MNVYNRKGITLVYQSVGFQDFGYIELEPLKEVMYMATAVSSLNSAFETTLMRVEFEIDPNNGSLLQKLESFVGLPGNCATRIQVTKYLVFVGCSKRGLIEVFRTDSLYKIDSKKISYFGENWHVL
jgi:6-phosphogluconolactonase (cycloisomerase 2 family)